MPASPPVAASNSARRLRAASPAVHGGASSLLRLARHGEQRLPPGAAMTGWAERAAAMLDLTPMMVGAASTAPAASAVTRAHHVAAVLGTGARA